MVLPAELTPLTRLTFSADEHCGRESRKKIPIHVPLHGSMRWPKVVSCGCDFHVFHYWPRGSITRHQFITREIGVRLTVSPLSALGQKQTSAHVRVMSALPP